MLDVATNTLYIITSVRHVVAKSSGSGSSRATVTDVFVFSMMSKAVGHCGELTCLQSWFKKLNRTLLRCAAAIFLGLWIGFMWLTEGVVCLHAAQHHGHGSNCSLTWAIDGRIMRCSIITPIS